MKLCGELRKVVNMEQGTDTISKKSLRPLNYFINKKYKFENTHHFTKL